MLDYYTPAIGDDLAKWGYLGLENYEFFSLKTIKFLGSHYLTCNGRVLDSVGPVITYALPPVAASVLMGFMAMFYFIAVLKAAELLVRNRVMASYATIFFVILLMPWWESMWLRVCQFNYMWSTAFCLFFFVHFFNCRRDRTSVIDMLIYFAVGILTSFSHEETGVCAVCALVVYVLVNRKTITFNRGRIILTVALVLGLVFAFGSPGIWKRASDADIPIYFGEMLYTTLPVVCLLVVCTVILAVFDFRRLTGLIHSPWVVYFVIALVGSAVAIYSGIIGRTGWLPETAAIVALILMADIKNCRVSKLAAIIISSLLMAAIAAHFISAIKIQRTLFKEYNDVLAEYVKDNDGVVYYDITLRPEFPIIALNHAQGVPDADDWYLFEVMSRNYKNDSVGLTVLPTPFRGQLDNIRDSLTHGDVTVYTAFPENCIRAVAAGFNDTINVITKNGAPYIVKPFTASGKKFWASSPLIVDKGDKWIPLDPAR